MPPMYETYQEVVAAKKKASYIFICGQVNYWIKFIGLICNVLQISLILGIGLHVYIWAFVLIWNWFGSAGSDCRQDIQK